MNVCVIGGGPAGVMAAYSAALRGAKVSILERNTEVLKKLCLTGNGRCNFSNADLSVSNYNFDAAHCFAGILKEYDSDWLEDLFKENGMLSIERDGLKYPRSEKAVTVKDTLLKMCKEKNVEILSSAKVVSLEKNETGFTVVLEDGKKMTFDKVIITTGGKAYPNTGSDGAGYKLARSLGHKVTFTYPYLTRLLTDDKDVLKLSGVRFKGKVSAKIDSETIDGEFGEIQFTDKGLSGICIYKLSRFLSKPIEEGKKCSIIIDFLPEMSGEELEEYLKTLLEKEPDKAGSTVYSDILKGMLGEDIAEAVIKRAAADSSEKADSKDTLQDVIKEIKAFTVSIKDHDTFSNAQVTGGGVDINEVDANMESKLCKGLYFAGEVLDVDGTCGGYNLHWAFASGFKAGESAGGFVD